MKRAAYSNIVIYRQLGFCLENLLHQKVLYNAYSTGRDQVFLGFKSTTSRDFVTLECRFVNGELLFFIHLNQPLNNARKSLAAFKTLHNTRVVNVISPFYERHFCLEFEQGQYLLFKGYGRFGNIIKFEGMQKFPEYEDVFRKNIKSDLQSSVEGYFRHSEKDADALKRQFPFVPDALFQHGNDLNALLLSLKPLFSNEENLKENNRIGFETDERTDASLEILVERLNNLASVYMASYYFRNEKTQKLLQVAAQIKKTRAGIKDASSRLEKLLLRRNFRELGDIVLAHAQSIGPGVENAIVQDLYLGGKITIKLNPLQSVSENAERYYKKEQNARIESQMLTDRLQSLQKLLSQLNDKEQRILATTDMKGLREGQTRKENRVQEQKTSQNNLPYKEFEFEGMKIWVGKNAKSNDQLLKLAHRNDIWMHARNVQGSHVIIRSGGKNVSVRTMNYAAGLAAFHSKAKTQDLVPVQYTERKYVSKPKNSNAGEVTLIKEFIVDAEPTEG